MGEMRGVDLPEDVELAYTGAWAPGLRDHSLFRELDLTDVTDEILCQVGGMPWITRLKARGDFTDAGVEELHGLTDLTDLTLDSPRLQGEFALPEADLRVVSLTGARLTDRSFRMLGLHPELKVVRLAAEEATGTGLCWLPPGLRMLYLRLPRLAPECLDFLSHLPYLSTLTFSGTIPTLRLASHLVRYAGQLSRVDFLGVEQPPPEILRTFAEAGIKVNAAAPMRRTPVPSSNDHST